jgi:putative ATPase
VENGLVILVAATTENPSFSIIQPLLSRSIVVTLASLEPEHIGQVLDNALIDQRGLKGLFVVDPEAKETLVRISGGDARKALGALEAAASVARQGSSGEDVIPLSSEHVVAAMDHALVRYDANGDQHYDVISAFIKSIRGSDADAAVHYLARMLEAGEDPRFIARRLIISASEDIGLSDPQALGIAVDAAQAVALIGMPEGRIPLAEATIYLALATKSNAAYVAINEAQAAIRSGHIGTVPAALRDAHYQGSAALGHGVGYLYPHSFDAGIVGQRYAPQDVPEQQFYRPTQRGLESELRERLAAIRKILAKDPPEATT